MRCARLLSAAIVLFLMSPLLGFSADQLVAFQGKVNYNGAAVNNGNLSVNIWNAASGGTLLYSDSFLYAINNSFFDVMLGAAVPLNLSYGENYWLNISVNGQGITWAGGNSRMKFYSSTGNTSSSVKLSSAGDNTLLNATNGTVNSGLFVGTLSGGNAGASIGTNSNHQFRLFTGGTDRLIVDTNGNVGIGTASPSAKLHINQSQDSNLYVTLENNYNTSNALAVIHIAGQNSKRIDVAYAPPSNTLFGFQKTNGIGVINADGGVLIRGGTSGTNIAWFDDASGNVGIGTTSPSGKLDIVSGSAGDGIVLRGTGSNSPGIGFYNGATWGGNMGLALVAGHFLPTSAVNDWAFNPQSNLLLGAGAAERMRITSAGNVGIGTTSPRSLLHTYGGGHVYIQGTGGGGGTAFTSTDTIPAGPNIGLVGYNGLALIPSAWGGVSTDRHESLYIAGTQTISSAISAALGFGNWGYFTNTGTGAGGLGNSTAQGDAVKFKFNLFNLGGEFNQRLDLISRSASGVDTNAISVLSNGNVGIGTTSPLSKLSFGTQDGTNKIGLYEQGTEFWGFNTQSGYLQFWTGNPGAVRMKIGGTGAVGLSTLGAAAATTLCYNTVDTPGFNTISVCSSSARYKEDIAPLVVDKSKVFQLQPVSFKWKNRDERGVGLIAEDVQKLVPEIVTYYNGTIDGVEYKLLTVYLLDIVKNQDKQIDQLKQLVCLDHPSAPFCR